MSENRSAPAAAVASTELAETSGDIDPSASARNSRTAWTKRSGLVLRIRDRDGHTGVGEASPLLGYSPDTLEQCRAELAGLPWGHRSNPRAMAQAPVTVPRARELTAALSSGAARFAAATALLDLIGQVSGHSLWRLLQPPGAQTKPVVPLNALVSDLDARDPAIAIDHIARARARGIDCIKAKVGRDFARELAALRAIRAEHGSDIAIRLDANRAWSAAQAARHLDQLRDIAPEYIEEPSADLAGLLALGDPPIPLALDESLADSTPSNTRHVEQMLERGHIRAVVLKPMVLGLFSSLDWALRARARGCIAVISHLLGGPIELAACTQLAIALGTEHPCGLDRHPGLSAWPDIPIPWLEASHITAPDQPGLGIDLAPGRETQSAEQDRDLSISAAANEQPERIGLIVLDSSGQGRAYTYAQLSKLTLSAASPDDTPMAVTGERNLDTALAIYKALEGHIPMALIHAKATPDERHRILAACRRNPRATASAAAILFTSGSSAEPKGVLSSRRAFTASAAASAERLGWHRDDRWLCCLPLGHIGGLSILTRCLIARQCAVLAHQAPFDPRAIITAIAEHRITLLSLVPTMLARMLDAGWSPPSFLRAVLLGGAAARKPLLERAAERGVPALVTYGMTEACSQICTQLPGTGLQENGHIGPPLPGIEIRVAQGRIAVRGPVLLSAYLTANGSLEPALDADGWLDTGDRGWIDEAGHLHVLGRIDDTIITGGENVHPGEVEVVLERHPAIALACAFGLPDPTWGQIIACTIVPRGTPPALDELAGFLASELPSHKRPRKVEIASELPLGATGKPDRRAAAARASASARALRYS